MMDKKIKALSVAYALAGATVTAGLGATTMTSAEAATNPCSALSELGSGQTLSASCRNFLLHKLDASIYFEGNKPLEVATYQKEAGLAVDGSLGPTTARHILSGDKLHIASPRPYSTEFLVDKNKQVGYYILNGLVKNEVSVSTGTERAYADTSKIDGHIISGTAHTPTGNWRVFRTEGPDYKAPLGPMPNARFFVGGIAVHGDPTSFHGRGSHGCIRIDPSAMASIIPHLPIGAAVEVVEHL